MNRFLIASASALVVISGGVLTNTAPSQAQLANVKQHLQSLPTTRIVFARGKTSKEIQGADDRIYILRANKGQRLTLNINNLGARANVTLYGTNGKPISPVYAGLGGGQGKTFSVKLPATGDYHIVGGGGPSYHLYNFLVTIK